MAALRLLVLFMVGTILLCQVSADPLWEEILRENLHDQEYNSPACSDKYRSNICGMVVNQDHCMKSKSRMGKFAAKNCKRMCGFC
ncbi:U-actitoxin-Avd8e [Exaiptasia diaphana]|uniref:ShKT domain-containing protein n=1 Tax=Exaiptasia diaphana TaxID=2652724 RepID=A0A913YAN4_EXADI|nr:U-actitoxin-Avd8e [Exaiptasia diaphana]XP_028512425.1 U-actitoxin-Avd8e [Exaiptasia diaphana]KXJ21172.1 hypothetical protein AC249_AIPGENE25162 [Exaiptasia diaphana]